MWLDKTGETRPVSSRNYSETSVQYHRAGAFFVFLLFLFRGLLVKQFDRNKLD